MEDTIVAISTSIGAGAIAIIRLSGKDAIEITNKFFKGSNLNNVKTHTIHYGYIVDNDNIIDEVLVSIMKSPKTYTTEDIVEINTHGGIATTNKVLELCLNNGARLAEPGEFTKRAFLNGRIDLTEAEAVSDLIKSDSEDARSMAVNQLTGSLSNLIVKTRKELVSLMSNIEVNIDYPEYEDTPKVTKEVLKKSLIKIKESLNNLVNESANTKIIKDGLNVVLLGKPNVGKSSLLNKLLNEDKAIVTDVAGTTRDIVEGQIILKGIKINLIDTAGIHDTDDMIEHIGVEKSISKIETADLIILILNNNEKQTADDLKLIKMISSKPHLIFINKDDLSKNVDINDINDGNIIFGNTISSEGIEPLKEAIIKMFNLEQIKLKDQTYLTNARQKSLVLQSIKSIEDAIKSLNNNVPIDMIEEDLKTCFDTLGEIIGVTYKDELIDEMFSHFCLGK